MLKSASVSRVTSNRIATNRTGDSRSARFDDNAVYGFRGNFAFEGQRRVVGAGAAAYGDFGADVCEQHRQARGRRRVTDAHLAGDQHVAAVSDCALGRMTTASDANAATARAMASADSGAAARRSRHLGADDARGVRVGVAARAGAPGEVASGASLRTAIEALAGFEIVAMAGFFAAGARLGATLLVDGYVATSAALIAWHLQPESVHSMIAGHRSAESGHGAALACLGLEPLLDWNMRLGEGTGALVALPMLDSAAALLRDVAALSDLGVARED